MDQIPTFGVEEEFLLVDERGHLSDRGPEIVEAFERPDGDVQRELARCQVELATEVCHGAEELLDQLTHFRSRLAGEAAKRQLRLIATGTPLLAEEHPPSLTPTPRYRRMGEHFGLIARTGTTCGCHVHVKIPDRGTGVRISNHVRPWLPVLLALTANSPFDSGHDTRYSSWRHVLWSRWPSAGPPPLFGSLGEYESRVAAMLESGAMMDRGMIYWDIRLSEKRPTLEFRISDVAATAREATTLAVLVRGLVLTALSELDYAPPPVPVEVLRANLWRAARDGLDGSALHPETGRLTPTPALVGQLVERVRGALTETGDIGFVVESLAWVREHGNGAQRQRRAYAANESLTDVVDLLSLR
ncbi:putative glutamate--cysteine ligase 2 [Amycolatopsis deserti]|uniref:Putative glutamate--cysteine ligase 2 n=1 Tax=Amycolatopsis deserti TaxID=185696 RepID=A0ABQ3JDM0_9PSEU|nr:glutamate--cysteine ligase [Amycolatopsis deserti]GHF21873.1 putative glutamate--cysteine ligase 2 [Amycolatopsis deserti]